MLLDAIQNDSLPAIMAAITERRKEIHREISEIVKQQEDYEEQQRQEAAAAEAAAAAAAAAAELGGAPEGEEEGITTPKGKDKKKGGKEDKKKASKEELEEEKRKQAALQAEEEARRALEERKVRLGEEEEKLNAELAVIKEVKLIDLFDGDSNPCNLRQQGSVYANTLLQAGGVYSLVQVQSCEEDSTTQIPIEVSIWSTWADLGS